MKEIKFRGKNTFNNRWEYGSLVKEKDGALWIIPEDQMLISEGGSFSAAHVSSETVGQYTGLKDKNGVEIYEGDVVMTQFSEKPFGVVTWHTDGYFFIDFSFGEWQYYGNGFVPLGEIMKRKIDGKSHQFEVIGNIHYNPKLLKQREQNQKEL